MDKKLKVDSVLIALHAMNGLYSLAIDSEVPISLSETYCVI